MITTKQAETIYDIFEGGWRMDDFMPLEVFRTDTVSDTAKVATCMELMRAELIKRVYIAPYDSRSHFKEAESHYRLALTEDSITKFYEYAKTCDYKFPWKAQ